ncbi:MAG: methyltransferase domain-containing protein [Gammaproteobacteria bacterium]|nr:methyltransferase domain-containing protein [Gammaproteobacteria bacterium]
MSRRGPRQIELTIESLSADGLGHGRFEGREVLARNALPGEMVSAVVRKRRRGFWYATAPTPAVRSPLRRSAPCPFYPRCGGCVMQHLDYGAQLDHKRAVLNAQLAEHNVTPHRQLSPVSGPHFYYRHKARLGVRRVGDEVLAGFREGFSNRVVRMDDCLTLALPFARMLPDLRCTLGAMSEPGRLPQVELTAGDRTFAIILRHLGDLDAADHARLRGFARRTGMRVYLQPGGYDSVHLLDDSGHGPYLSYANPDFGLNYEFLPTDFTQVNPYVNRSLVRAALLALAPRPGRVAVDLFCGIGNFSLALARLGVRVIGLESAPGAVSRARQNAAGNGLAQRAEFAVADLYDEGGGDLPEADYLLLDPPRSGAGPNLERWAGSSRVEKIVYVSCNPRTFASDAARLAESGYTLQEVGVFDMFPHTSHIETLGLFLRRRGGAGG